MILSVIAKNMLAEKDDLESRQRKELSDQNVLDLLYHMVMIDSFDTRVCSIH